MTARALALLLLLCSAACADTLVLRNGTSINGRWWAADADMVHFLVDGRLEHYPRPDVSEIVLGDPVAAPPPDLPPDVAPRPAAPRPDLPLVVVPERIGVVYFQDGVGNLLALEQFVATGHRVQAGLSNRRPGQYWEMPGTHSSFRLRADAALRFAVEWPGGIAPPILRLYQLDSKSGTRRTRVADTSPPDIPVRVRSLGGNVFVYSVVVGLAPGEYAFSPSNSNDSFCFGIDAPPGR